MLADVQNWPDARGIGLDEVGIRGVRYPVSIFDAGQGKQDTVATVSLSVSLPPEQKGSHLSRFMEILDAFAGELTPGTIAGVLRALQERLESQAARLQMSFPYFLRRRAPVSGASAVIDYDCGFIASVRRGEFSFLITAGGRPARFSPRAGRPASSCGWATTGAHGPLSASMSAYWITCLLLPRYSAWFASRAIT
jgi:GTP cyclohydrolase FolE2